MKTIFSILKEGLIVIAVFSIVTIGLVSYGIYSELEWSFFKLVFGILSGIIIYPAVRWWLEILSPKEKHK